MVILGLGTAAARKGDIALHMDSMFLAYMLLTAVATFRVTKLCAYLLMGVGVVSNSTIVWLLWAAILAKTLVVAVRGRLGSNGVSAVVIATGLCIAVSWSLVHRVGES